MDSVAIRKKVGLVFQLMIKEHFLIMSKTSIIIYQAILKIKKF